MLALLTSSADCTDLETSWREADEAIHALLDRRIDGEPVLLVD